MWCNKFIACIKKLKNLGCHYSFVTQKYIFIIIRNAKVKQRLSWYAQGLLLLSYHHTAEGRQHKRRNDTTDDSSNFRLIKKGLRSADSIEYQKDQSESVPEGWVSIEW